MRLCVTQDGISGDGATQTYVRTRTYVSACTCIMLVLMVVVYVILCEKFGVCGTPRDVECCCSTLLYALHLALTTMRCVYVLILDRDGAWCRRHSAGVIALLLRA